MTLVRPPVRKSRNTPLAAQARTAVRCGEWREWPRLRLHSPGPLPLTSTALDALGLLVSSSRLLVSSSAPLLRFLAPDSRRVHVCMTRSDEPAAASCRLRSPLSRSPCPGPPVPGERFSRRRSQKTLLPVCPYERLCNRAVGDPPRLRRTAARWDALSNRATRGVSVRPSGVSVRTPQRSAMSLRSGPPCPGPGPCPVSPRFPRYAGREDICMDGYIHLAFSCGVS